MLVLALVGMVQAIYIDSLKRAKIQLTQSEEQLNRAQSVAKIGSWALDVRSNILTWTEESFRIFGATSGTPLSYEAFLDCVHPDDRAYVHEKWSAALRGEPYDIEHRIIAHGEVRWVNERAELRFTPEGRLIGGIGIAQDITARKQNEEMLNLFARAFEQISSGVLITNARREIEFVNPAFTTITGYTSAAILGRNPRLLQSGQTPPEIFAAMWRALDEGNAWRGELFNQRKDGTVIAVQQFITPIRQPDGRITHYLAISDDITESKRIAGELDHYRLRLEELVKERTGELATNTARTQAILRTMLDGVIQIDNNGIMLSVNDAVSTLFGYEESELLGKNVSLLMPEPHRSAHDAYLNRYLETGSLTSLLGRRVEVPGQRKDGSIIPLELAVNELIDDAGITFIGVLSDISLRKAAEMEREAARIETERLAQLKSEFLANMSHEIRTPLNGIIGLARIGARDNHDRATHELYARIFTSGEHLLGVINDILDFSRIEVGKLVIEAHPFRLTSPLLDAASMVGEQAQAKQLNITQNFAPDLPEWVAGDSMRLRQILLNLLSNAVKFTERGSVELSLSRHGNEIIFRIADSGIGMTAEQVSRLFRPFEQADGSITRRFGGSGLGLAISGNLASLMGGEISVESAPGVGSTFILRLPLPAAAAPEEAAEAAAAPTATGHRLAGLRVLAAEDNEVNRLVLEDVLLQEGANVSFAENGQQVLDQLTYAGMDAFDVVLMDVQMPVMDGYETTRHILAIAPSLPIIGLTAHAMAEERDKSLAVGMVDHITKPIKPDELVAAILRHIPAAARADTDAIAVTPKISSADDETIIDWPALSERYQGRQAFIDKLVVSVLDSHAQTPTLLRDAIRANDLEAISFHAHSIKGVAGMIEATAVFQLASQTDERARAGDIGALDLAGTLAERVDELLATLNKNAMGDRN
jgi:PAS domain S-box-containing protein